MSTIINDCMAAALGVAPDELSLHLEEALEWMTRNRAPFHVESDLGDPDAEPRIVWHTLPVPEDFRAMLEKFIHHHELYV